MDNKRAQGLKTWAVKGGHAARVSTKTGGHEQAQGCDAGVWAQPCLCVQLNTSRCAPMAGATWRPAETPASGEVRPDIKSHPPLAPTAPHSVCFLYFCLLPVSVSPSPPHPHHLSLSFSFLISTSGSPSPSLCIFLGRAPQPHTPLIQPTPHRGPPPSLSVGARL